MSFVAYTYLLYMVYNPGWNADKKEAMINKNTNKT